MLKVEDIRNHFIGELMDSNFVTDKTGVKTIEMIGATFEADEPTIFGEINEDYIQRELDWYKSMSLYVDDIPGITPAIWQQVADRGGKINSNYGWAIYHKDNHLQYANVLNELTFSPNSRRAVMIYTRKIRQRQMCIRDRCQDSAYAVCHRSNGKRSYLHT